MRHSKRALLIFAAGGLLGLIVVSANLPGLARIASLAMAAGIALLPVALVADWWSHRPWRAPKPKPRAKPAKRGANRPSDRQPKPPAPRKRGSRSNGV